MTEVTMWGHAPCGWRYWTVKGDPDPVHDCPKEGGRRVPAVTLRAAWSMPITDGSGQVSDSATEWGDSEPKENQMTEVTLWGHWPCGWRTWTAEGEPPPEHDCPKGDDSPLVTMSGPEAVARLADEVSFLAQFIQLSEEAHCTVSEVGALSEIAERTERFSLPRSLGVDSVTGAVR